MAGLVRLDWDRLGIKKRDFAVCPDEKFQKM
jgi:hypothetical protein